MPSCGQNRHTRWPATNASACNEVLAHNEFQVLMCHHAVRKGTHAGLQQMLRHAMNYGCGTQPVLTRAFCQKKTHHCSSMEFETTIRLHKLSGFGKPRILCVNPGYLSKPYKNFGFGYVRYLYIYIYISLSLYLSVCLSVYLSIYLSMSLPIYFSICLDV